MNTDVAIWLDRSTWATTIGDKVRCLRLRDKHNRYASGPDIFFPSDTPTEVIRAIADAINAALAKVEDPADAS